MSELIDPRPRLVLVMGCNGSGKTAWKRANYDRLPEKYFDQDSIAGGIGDWDDPGARARTREYVDAEIAKCLAGSESFGSESTFSGRLGPLLVARAKAAGYRIEGYYIGTESPEINVRRIDERVLANTGHYVAAKEVPAQYGWSLSNLRKGLADFDLVEVVDNSAEAADRIPLPRTQFVAERGQVTIMCPADEMTSWCRELLRKRELDLRRQEIREKASAAAPTGDGSCGAGR